MPSAHLLLFLAVIFYLATFIILKFACNSAILLYLESFVLSKSIQRKINVNFGQILTFMGIRNIISFCVLCLQVYSVL